MLSLRSTFFYFSRKYKGDETRRHVSDFILYMVTRSPIIGPPAHRTSDHKYIPGVCIASRESRFDADRRFYEIWLDPRGRSFEKFSICQYPKSLMFMIMVTAPMGNGYEPPASRISRIWFLRFELRDFRLLAHYGGQDGGHGQPRAHGDHQQGLRKRIGRIRHASRIFENFEISEEFGLSSHFAISPRHPPWCLRPWGRPTSLRKRGWQRLGPAKLHLARSFQNTSSFSPMEAKYKFMNDPQVHGDHQGVQPREDGQDSRPLRSWQATVHYVFIFSTLFHEELRIS